MDVDRLQMEERQTEAFSEMMCVGAFDVKIFFFLGEKERYNLKQPLALIFACIVRGRL